MGSNRLGEAASFWLPSLAGVLEADASKGPDDPGRGISALPQTSSLFPMLQILRLHENSIKSIQGLQLHGFTGETIRHGFHCICLKSTSRMLVMLFSNACQNQTVHVELRCPDWLLACWQSQKVFVPNMSLCAS